MKKYWILWTFLLGAGLWTACNQESSEVPKLTSPDEKVSIDVFLTDDGQPAYTVSFEENLVIDTSRLGLDFKDQESMKDSFQILSRNIEKVEDSWEMPWGEQRVVEDNYTEARYALQEKAGGKRKLNLIFRAHNDGIGFRYEIPAQGSLEYLDITDENTEFTLTGDHETWWIPGDWDSYEHLYNNTRFSEIDTVGKTSHPNLVATYIPEVAVNTPVTLRTDQGVYMSFHEAALTDYAGITLKKAKEGYRFVSELVGSDRMGYKARVALPFQSPWRTIQLGDRAGDLIESTLIVNLNEPNKLGDVSSYFQPMKYMGIWWHMHLGKNSWDYKSGKHGATTEEAKRMIDYAARHKIKGMLSEVGKIGSDSKTEKESLIL